MGVSVSLAPTGRHRETPPFMRLVEFCDTVVLGACRSRRQMATRNIATMGVPLRAPAPLAQFPDCSPRTHGAQPVAVLRLALRPRARFGRRGGPLRGEWRECV